MDYPFKQPFAKPYDLSLVAFYREWYQKIDEVENWGDVIEMAGTKTYSKTAEEWLLQLAAQFGIDCPLGDYPYYNDVMKSINDCITLMELDTMTDEMNLFIDGMKGNL